MAGKGIKGITIEIGGNTTPLQKALKDVNSASSSLKSELREVERLLKLDPTNTTLLAQKQELLSKSVDNTKGKLEQLRSVQEQIEQQYQNKEIDEGAYRAFQRELAATENELAKTEAAIQRMRDAEEDIETETLKLNKTIKEQEGSLQDLKDIYQDVVLSQGKNSEEAKNLEKEIENLDDELKQNKKRLEDSAYATEKNGDSAEKAASGWQKFGEGLGKAVKAAAVATAAVTAAFFGLAEETREARENMGKLETSFTTAGHSAEVAKNTYTELYGVLGDDGQATEAAAHLAKLTTNEQELATWTDICTGVYATFGDSLPIEGLTEAANETAKTGEITGSLADALNWAGVKEDEFQASLDACSSEQERQALITQTLNGLYSDAAEKYREVNGDIIEAQKATAQFNDAMAALGAIAEPIVTQLKTLVAELLQEITPFVALIGEGLAGALSGAEDAAEKFSEGLMGIVTYGLDALIQMLPAILEFAAQMIATIATGIAESLPELIPTLVQLVTDIAAVLIENLPLLLEALLQIVEGLALGIIDALPIIVEALPELITGIIDALVAFIPQFIETGITIFVALVESLPEIIDQICDALPQIITAIVEGLTNLIPKLIECGVKLFVAIVENLPQIIVSVVAAIPKIISAIVQGFASLFSNIAQVGQELFGKLVENGSSIIAEISGFVGNLVSSIVSTITSWFSSFFDVGYNIVSGIWSGISSGWSWLTSQVSSLASSLLSAAKSALGINSPSTRFRDEVGKMMAEGIGAGFDLEIPKTFSGVKNRLKTEEAKLAQSVTTTNSTVNNTTSLGGIAVHIHGNVGSVAEANRIGETVAEKLARELRYKGVLSLA